MLLALALGACGLPPPPPPPPSTPRSPPIETPTVPVGQPPPLVGERGGAKVRVCAWNLRKLGFENKPPRPRRDYKLMAKIVDANCDVAGIVEMMAKVSGIPQPGYAKLGDALGHGWGKDISARGLPGTTGANDEKYAFYWRKERVKQCSGFGVKTYPDPGNRFVREPSASCFEAPPAKKGFDFILSLYHAPAPKSHPEREIPPLARVATWMQGLIKGERDLFIGGDFNLNSKPLEKELRKTRKPLGPFAANEMANVFAGSRSGTTLDAKGDVTSNHYDHFIIVFPKDTKESLTGERWSPPAPERPRR